MERLLYVSPAIVAIIIYIWLKNKAANRQIERRNRLLDKQEALIEMLKEQKVNSNSTTEITENTNTNDDN